MNSVILPRQERYDVKTISYDEDGPGWYDIMMVKFTGSGNDALEDAGYGGEHIIYMSIKGGVRHATSDFRELSSTLTAVDDNHLSDLLAVVEYEGGWEMIDGGMAYTPENIDALLGR